MRIGYDARILADSQMTGIGQYTYHLLKSLGSLSSAHRFMLFPPRRSSPCDLPSGAIERVISMVPRDLREDRFYKLWFDIYLPLRIRLSGIDIFHGPSYLIPNSRRARTVVTVHDLTHERYPSLALGCSPEFMRRARESVLRADAVIAVSRFTREDLVELYRVDEGKVRVIYEGVDPRFRIIDDRDRLDSFRFRYRLPQSFVLSVISLHPRKNLPRLLRAFSILRERTSLPQKLVVTGKDYGEMELRRIVDDAGLKDDFHFINYLPQEELPLLYNLADAFVFPTLYEGFGLPPLEAMACGTPVAASRAGSLPEVLGEAALYFNPEDMEEMAERMEELLGSESEMERFRSKGVARAKKYRWEECARRTLELYEELF